MCDKSKSKLITSHRNEVKAMDDDVIDSHVFIIRQCIEILCNMNISSMITNENNEDTEECNPINLLNFMWQSTMQISELTKLKKKKKDKKYIFAKKNNIIILVSDYIFFIYLLPVTECM